MDQGSPNIKVSFGTPQFKANPYPFYTRPRSELPVCRVALPGKIDAWLITRYDNVFRYQVRSTILTAQLPVARWHEQIGDPTLADGILDRLVHNAHRIEMRGDSTAQEPWKAKRVRATAQPNKMELT